MVLHKKERKYKRFLYLRNRYWELQDMKDHEQVPLDEPIHCGYIFRVELKEDIPGLRHYEKRRVFSPEKLPDWVKNWQELPEPKEFYSAWTKDLFGMDHTQDEYSVYIGNSWLGYPMYTLAEEYRKCFRVRREKLYTVSQIALDSTVRRELAEVKRELESFPQWRHYSSSDRSEWKIAANKRRNFRQQPSAEE